MSNFFYKYSDYSSFQKAFKDVDGEDVVVNLFDDDESLKTNKPAEPKKHVIRKDNRFNKESSYDRFFGPRKSKTQNFDMRDFSSWKNKNYRETEKQLDEGSKDKIKFSFSDFMNERSGGRKFNDDDQNKMAGQKAINEMSTEDPTFKRFSLNDYMRRLEERTRVKAETRDNEDLIEAIGEKTQVVTPDSSQDENFDESENNLDVVDVAQDDSLKGDEYRVAKSELEELRKRLYEVNEKTEEIKKLIGDDEDVEIEEVDEEEDLEDDLLKSAEVDEASEDSTQPTETSEEDIFDESSGSEENVESQETTEPNEQTESEETLEPEKAEEQPQTAGQKEEKPEGHRDAGEIQKLISKNEQEKQEIAEKLKLAEEEKLSAQKSYEDRLKELEKSIGDKDKETQKQVLLEKIKHDNKLTIVRAEFESREEEIRKLEKEAALKIKIGELLKKELKTNLNISNLEMNNKLLEITTLINQEKQKAKANKPKTTRKRTKKRRVDSDIIGSIDIE